jgi:glycosyltransferase involved in cell wall biosynthesis
MLIVTNIASFPKQWTASDGTTGRTEFAPSAAEFLRFRRDTRSVFLVNCDARLALALALERVVALAAPRPLIALDLVFLRRPQTIPATLAALSKRFLLRNVDYFLHYFKDLRGLDSVYGIGPGRSGFVDFKANLWNSRVAEARPDGEYALCFGRSLRDFDTFFDALQRLECPGAIVDPQLDSLREHGSRFTRSLSAVPANVRVLADDHTERSQAAALEGAKIVVVPMVRGRLIAAGISTVLNAMALGKCVIATAGPGVTDIFDGELVSVPPEDPEALAAAIARVWHDTELRRRTAQAGWEYARRCGSEQDFNRRVIDAVVKWSSERGIAASGGRA